MARQIGPYELQEKLGQGGMGVVFRAAGPDGPAAVKIIRGADIAPSAITRFRREAQIRIEHPYIVRVLDAGCADDGTSYIAFELLEGQTLEQRLRRGTLLASEAMSIGIMTCRGLVAAHAEGVIHRDLKPSNLFLCAGGEVKVLDFGVAFLQSKETRMTQTGSVLGTPAYLSPEQARGHTTIDARADLWALGAVLYECLAGRPPFVRDTALAVLVALVMDRVVPLQEIVAGLPANLVHIVDKALNKDREERWSDAPAMLAALESASSAGDSDEGTAETIVDQSAPPMGLSTSEPEKRIVSVLLAADVENLTGLRRAIERQRGLLYPLVGNRAVGVFGAERWEGDEPRRAVMAALEARSTSRILSISSGHGTRSREGIAGVVLASAEHGTNQLQRGVVADGETATLLRDRFKTRELAGDFVQILQRGSSTLHPPTGGEVEVLVGRQMEVAQLGVAVEAAFEEQRSLAVVLSGSAGVGKSALGRTAEKLVGKRRPAPLVLASRAEFRSEGRPFGLLFDALKGHLQAVVMESSSESSDGDDAEVRARAALHRLVQKAMGADQSGAESTEAFLGDLLELGADEPIPEETGMRDARLMADRVRLSLLDLFEGLSAVQPVVLLIDLHQSDSQSIDLTEELLERLRDRTFLVIAEARPAAWETRPNLFSSADVVRIELRGLQSKDVGRLLQRRLAKPPSDQLTRQIAKRTSGNPLFIEQLAAAITSDHGSVTHADDLPLPLSVEAAVQSRLDHLPAAEKELLKQLALIGGPSTAEFLRLVGVDEASTLVASLARRDLVSSRRDAGSDPRFWFRSALVAEVAYRLIADERKQALHAQVAQCLEQQTSPEAAELARHLEASCQLERAAERYADATLRSARRGDSAGVLRWSERALELSELPGRAYSIHMARADAFRFTGQPDKTNEELQAARDSASGDAELARALTDLAFSLHRLSRDDEALVAAEGAEAAARRSEDGEAIGLALGWQSVVLAYNGKLDRAIVLLSEACALMSQRPESQALAAEWRAQVHAVRGDLGARRAAFEDAVRYYGAAGHIRQQVGAECNLADVYNRVGDYQRAEVALSAAIEGCRRVNNRLMEGYAQANRGYCQARLGQVHAALDSLRTASDIAKAGQDARLAAAARVYRSRVRLSSDTDYEVIASEAIDSAREADEAGLPSVAALGLALAAAALLKSGQNEKALELSTRAMALRDSMGGLEEDEGELFLTHVRALEANERGEEAQSVRQRGCTRLKEIADRISDPAVRSQFLEKIPEHRELLGGTD